jgi:hypothetical protein
MKPRPNIAVCPIMQRDRNSVILSSWDEADSRVNNVTFWSRRVIVDSMWTFTLQTGRCGTRRIMIWMKGLMRGICWFNK